MQQHNQEVFLIEGLQPTWLQTRGWQWGYILTSRLIGGPIVGLSAGLIALVFFGLEGGPIVGLRVGLPLGFVDILRFEWLRQQRLLTKPATYGWSVANVMIVSLIVGLIIVLSSRGMVPPITGLIFGSIVGLIFGLRDKRQSSGNDIQPVEALHWSWRKALRGGLIGGLIAGLLMLIGELGNVSPALTCFHVASQSFCVRVTDSMIPVLTIGGLIGVIFSGLSREITETKSVPNQGIWLSIRNAIFGGLIVGLIGFLLFGLEDELIVGLILGLILGPLFGLIGALWYGGLDVIQHYTLRLILIIQGHTPANYARFLDYAADRIFLQKVGGGYRFIHRLLLEHFAEIAETRKA